MRNCSWVVQERRSRTFCSRAENDSIAALSPLAPAPPMLPTTRRRARARRNFLLRRRDPPRGPIRHALARVAGPAGTEPVPEPGTGTTGAEQDGSASFPCPSSRLRFSGPRISAAPDPVRPGPAPSPGADAAEPLPQRHRADTEVSRDPPDHHSGPAAPTTRTTPPRNPAGQDPDTTTPSQATHPGKPDQHPYSRPSVPWLIVGPLARLVCQPSSVSLRPFDWIARAAGLTTPTLIPHGARDDSAPIQLSQALRDARPALVELTTFDADHALSWNTYPDRWHATVTSWLRARISG